MSRTAASSPIRLARGAVPGFWHVPATNIAVMRVLASSWKVTCLNSAGSCPSCRWLRDHQLLEASFSTRGEATRTLSALLRSFPAPVVPAPKLVRRDTGLYETADGLWQVHRVGGDWQISLRGAPTNSRVRTLHIASRRIAQESR